MLVADDEPVVRDVARQLFERLGAHVTTANNCAEVRQILASPTAAFDVFVVDVTLLDCRCEELMGDVVRRLPSCRLVAMSGYDPSRTPNVPGNHVYFLQKPFTLDVIRHLLEQMGFTKEDRSAQQ